MKKMEIEISDIKININIFNAYINTQYSYEDKKEIKIPKILSISERLKYIKKVIKTIIDESNPQKISISVLNTNQKNIIDIIKYEGAIEELLDYIGVVE